MYIAHGIFTFPNYQFSNLSFGSIKFLVWESPIRKTQKKNRKFIEFQRFYSFKPNIYIFFFDKSTFQKIFQVIYVCFAWSLR